MKSNLAARSSARLVLLGGGHAHLRVLESLRSDDWPPVQVVLVSPEPRQLYSGMVPGYLQDTYDLADLSLSLDDLARRAGVRFAVGRASRIDVSGRSVRTGEGEIPFDFLSVDIGSVPGGLDRPGVRTYAFPLRPLERAAELRRRVEELAARQPSLAITIVGGGAGGIETGLALHRRARACGSRCSLTLIDREQELLRGYGAKVRSRARRILEACGATVLLGEAAASVDQETVGLGSGDRIPSDIVVWTTGAAPPPLLDHSDLPRSASGYFAVDATLRSRDGSPVWGAGDCIDLEGSDIPKAGVYAVRQGPVLANNLRAAISGGTPGRYEAQSSFLSILNTADGRALLRWKGLVTHSKPAWWLKDWIDRRFVGRYAG